MSTPAFAYENYMIISKLPVKSISVKNQEILSVKPVFTIDNSKKNIILQPVTQGKTQLEIDLYNAIVHIDVKVEKDKTYIKKHDGFNYFVIDSPPKPHPILDPPLMGDN